MVPSSLTPILTKRHVNRTALFYSGMTDTGYNDLYEKENRFLHGKIV